MVAFNGLKHEPYRGFRDELRTASEAGTVFDIFFTHVSRLNGTAAAIIEAGTPSNVRPPRLITRCRAARGPQAFWQDYLALSRTGRDLITRIIRLSPNTLTLEEIRRHPHLPRRAAPLERLLSRHNMSDLIAIPGIDPRGPTAFAIVAGANLALRRTRRHFVSRMAMDVLDRIADIAAAPDLDNDAAAQDAPGLTDRQLEIAHWLVAGKTDWEIGEILQISPKTVNYHVEKMKQLYGVHSRHQFVAAIVHQGAITPAPQATTSLITPGPDLPRQRQSLPRML